MAGRGFAAMAPEQRRAISSLGGKAAHAAGTAHRWTAETGSAAGKKGGVAPHSSRGPRRTVPPTEPKLPAAEQHLPEPSEREPKLLDAYEDDEGPVTERRPNLWPHLAGAE